MSRRPFRPLRPRGLPLFLTFLVLALVLRRLLDSTGRTGDALQNSPDTGLADLALGQLGPAEKKNTSPLQQSACALAAALATALSLLPAIPALLVCVVIAVVGGRLCWQLAAGW